VNFFQTLLQIIEVGRAQALVRIIPLGAAMLLIGIAYDHVNYRGLNDAQSMDNAQLARQIARGQGFTTEFLRPHAIAQLRDFAVAQGKKNGHRGDLFPPDQFPPGAPRILPDTYNAPGYPYLLAAWFRLVHPEFEEPSSSIVAAHSFSGDQWIPPLNQIFMLLTALMVFILGHRLFDQRVAWMSLIAFLGTDLVWSYSVTGLSTTLLMFLVTAVMICAVEIVSVGEACFVSEERSFGPAWIWALGLAVFLVAACLTRLHLVILLIPLTIVLLVMRRASYFLPIAIGVFVLGILSLWFLHVKSICGNPLGSNTPLLLFGEGNYKNNEIYCTMSLPSYEQLFRDASKKEYSGFRYHFEHAWSLLGANPLILLFGASLLHQFKRRATWLFQWLLFISALFLIAANNLGVFNPESLSSWNIIIVLFPCMIVIGGAFFFILLDRLNLHMGLLITIIVTVTLLLSAMPLGLRVADAPTLNYNYPPYVPPMLKLLGEYSGTDEWVTTDMPWATAWYSDRASLWLPDSITEFQNLHDNVCNTGILMLTPVSWEEPTETFKTGEYKDWFSFAMDLPVPPTFPLSVHTLTAGPNYSLWSDRPRWQGK
jgi:4-amino-4-deoxy-L-arabinose transferase-like glycosyltransferase